MTTIFIIALAALAHGERLASQDANLAAMAPEVINELVRTSPCRNFSVASGHGGPRNSRRNSG